MLPLTLCGCVQENDNDCRYPLRLRFTYTYNREQTDLFGAEIPAVRLLLYDAESGLLVDDLTVAASELDKDNGYSWMVPPGKFALLTFGGDVAAIDSYRSDSLRDMAAALDMEHTTHLWHNLTTDILINGDLTPYYEIDLHKLTNEVTVSVHEADDSTLADTPDPAALLRTSIQGTNAMFDHQGHVHGNARRESYSPDQSLPMQHHFTVGSLARDDDSALAVSYDNIPVYDGSLTELIARQPDIIFDLDDEFFVDFIVSGAGATRHVTITVNKWIVSEYNVTLQ